MESKIRCKSTDVGNKNTLTDTESRLVVVGVGREGVGAWSSRGKLLHPGWRNNTVILCSAGTCSQCSVTDRGEKNIYICHFLPQVIFPTRGLNMGLLHCGQMLYHLSHPILIYIYICIYIYSSGYLGHFAPQKKLTQHFKSTIRQ